MFCTKCGAKLKEDDKVCKKCGQTVEQGKDNNPAVSGPAPAPAAPIQPAQKPKTAGACGSCLAGLAIIFVVVVLIAAFSKYSPKSGTTNPNSSTSTGNSSSGSGNKNNSSSGQTTTPSTQTTKQLYYSVSCSNCQSQVCQRSYNYAGWDAGFYQYYKDICDSCTCADKKSQSVWR